MSQPPALHIGARVLGAGHPCYVIGEAGSNHNGSFEQALRLIDVAAEARCDAVKFQIFKADKLYPPGAGKSDYLGDARSIDEIIRQMELPEEWLPKLVAYSREKGLDFLCSGFDEGAVDLVAPYVDAFKCASYEMSHTPLLQHMVRLGKPVLLSTGSATLDEVGEAVAAVRAVAQPGQGLPLVLLQCTASYPAPLESAHVRALVTMRDAFEVWTGLSDHTDGSAAAVAAVALGAVVVEKHYTLSKRLPGPDHVFALEPHELCEMVTRIRECERSLGNPRKVTDPVEQELRSFARRSIFTSRAIAAGEAFTTSNTAVLRRGKLPAGLEPRHHPQVLSHVAARDLPAFASLQPDDVAAAPELQPPRLTLRRAGPDDARAVWTWNNDPTARAVSLSPEPIAWERHLAWFSARIVDAAVRMWIIEVQGKAAGVARIDRPGANRGVVSIAIAPEARGQGVATDALRLACARLHGETGDAHVEAVILPENAASLRTFAKAGFELEGERQMAGRRVTVHGCRLG